jgi:hypothetical protein
MAYEFFDYQPEVPFIERDEEVEMRKSRHSRRMVPISLSQKALAVGVRGGVFNPICGQT